MKTNLIFTITLFSLLIFSCRNPFKVDKTPGTTYTVSGYLAPFSHLPDSVWGDTNISVLIQYNSNTYRLKSEEVLTSTDANGYFSFEYTTPAYAEELVNDSLTDIYLWVAGDSGYPKTPYTRISTECNISNYHFEIRNRVKELIPQGTCN